MRNCGKIFKFDVLEYVMYLRHSSSNLAWTIDSRSLASDGARPGTIGPLKRARKGKKRNGNEWKSSKP